MLKVNAAPLANRQKDLDLMCFPDLFPFGQGGQHDERKIKLTSAEFIKCKLLSKHSEFRLNQQYLFFLLNDANMRQISSGIFHKLNVGRFKEHLTAAKYLELLSNDELEADLTTVFSKLRNTEQFWNKPRNDLRCMIQHYGPATFFMTLSPSEWLWDDLGEYLRSVNEPELSNKSISELVVLDPVSTSRFIENKFRSMLDFILSEDAPIGKIEHYFYRREYQGRGLQHFHLLLWVEGAPLIGESSKEEIVTFILKYVTCKTPDSAGSPELARKVKTHQHHRCNSYCIRSKKTKKGHVKVCRFGFPRPVTPGLVLRDVVTAVAGRKTLRAKSRHYDLPRNRKEVYTNDYNPAVLLAWEGNMDLQVICESSLMLTYYCTKYTTKSEKSHAVEIFRDINSLLPLAQRLYNAAIRSISNRECGALEAADTLLSIPLYGTDRNTTIRWLDVNIVRSRKLKTKDCLENLPKDSTDIYCSSIVDNYYPERPKELENMHLYDFARWHDIIKKKPNEKKALYYSLSNGLYLKKRERAYLINHYKFNPNQEPEKYFYALLLLFKPWRDISELKGDATTFGESFDRAKADLEEGNKYHELLSEILKGKEKVEALLNKKIEEFRETTVSQNNNPDNPLAFQAVEAESAMNEFRMAVADLQENVEDMILKLNKDQKRVFDRVFSTLESEEVLRHFVSGTGGTGKSFLIKTIKAAVKAKFNKDVAVTAPTGIAAFNVGGLTVHRLLQLPVEHGQTPKYTELSDDVLKIIRDEVKNVILFIIDEVSMISNVNLLYIHLRLSEIYDTKDVPNGFFGKKHVLVFGDLLQLPPVLQDSAFVPFSMPDIEKYLGSLGNINLWTRLMTYDELSINMRQKNDKTFADMLTRIRLGSLTPKDYETLQTRLITLKGSNSDSVEHELANFISSLSKHTVCLLPTRRQCDALNTAMLDKIDSPKIILNAEDTIDCGKKLEKAVSNVLKRCEEDSSRTAGLEKVIILKIGAKVMVRRNLDVTVGLVNGAIGELVSVSKSVDTHEITRIRLKLTSGEERDIERTKTKFKVMDRAFVFRKQFPVNLAYAITIHKSQGLSLDNVVVDVGNTVFSCGQAYVALSRVTSLQGLHLINLDPKAIKAQPSAIKEYNRLRKSFRPDLCALASTRKASKRVPDRVWAPYKVTDPGPSEPARKIFKPNVSEVSNVTGLINSPGDNMCYANSVIQCILNVPRLREELQLLDIGHPFRNLASSYAEMRGPISAKAVRDLAGLDFQNNRQQDAAEFLELLARNVEPLERAMTQTVTVTTSCTHCNHSDESPSQNLSLILPISEIQLNTKMDDLLEHRFRPVLTEDGCRQCPNGKQITKYTIQEAGALLVIQLALWRRSKGGRVEKITNLKISGVPKFTMKVGNINYLVHSAIFHEGAEVESGHYTCVLRNQNSWLKVDDEKSRKEPWPRCAKNLYMLILKKSD